MTHKELDQLIRRVDKLLNEVEQLPDDQFTACGDYYQTAFDFREKLRIQEVEYLRGHLERSFAVN